LVKNQTNAAHNGRYTLTTVGDGSTPWVLTRSTLEDDANEIPGSFVFVNDGTTNEARGFVLSVANPATFTVGTDDITVTQFSQAQAYIAGAGLVLNGSTFDVATASSSRIVVNENNIDLASVNTTSSNSATSNVTIISSITTDSYGRVTNIENAQGIDGYYLKSNTSTTTGLEWAAIPPVSALDDIGDVTITSASSGQFLKWNGSAWVNDSIPIINALNDVGDVTITSVAENQLLQYNGSAWVNTSDPTVGGNLTISGNLIVSGTTTTVNSETLTINDNIIVLNNNEAGTPSENAGIEVQRGTSTNVLLRWNEANDCWEFTNDGATYQRIVGDTITNAQSASYTLALADRSKMIEMSVASGNTLTVPPNSSVAYPVGTTITVLQTGAGQTTITPGSGVTINATPGLKLRAQWSSATLIKRATDTWVALGDLAA